MGACRSSEELRLHGIAKHNLEKAKKNVSEKEKNEIKNFAKKVIINESKKIGSKADDGLFNHCFSFEVGSDIKLSKKDKLELVKNAYREIRHQLPRVKMTIRRYGYTYDIYTCNFKW